MERHCPECRAPVADDQRYCLGCGHRVGALRLDWREVVHGRGRATAPVRPGGPALGPVALPTPRVAATLLLIVMGFGVVVAGAAGPTVPRTLAAAARGPITVQLPPRPPAPAPAPAAAAPEPAPVEPAPPPAPAPAPALPVAAPVAPPAPAPKTPLHQDTATTPADAPAVPEVPPVKHVFVLALGPGTFDQWFGDQSAVPYLAKELAPQGTLLASYAATAAGELSNQITMISGQPATAQTDANCPTYSPMAEGDGCVRGPDAYTIPDQLTPNGLSWKAYIEGQDAPGADPASCRHPQDGEADPFFTPGRPGDPYVTWRNPFVYFQTVTGSEDCAKDDVGLTPLDEDLKAGRRTPAFSWIAPAPGNSGPTPDADAWLRIVVPKIMSSKAYKQDGLLVVVPDASGTADSMTTGALMLSRYAPASISYETFDHLSLVKGIDDLFGLQYLPGADGKKVKSLASLLLH